MAPDTGRTVHDQIVVGAGTAGCVIARRLVERGVRVLLLEAGGPDDAPEIHRTDIGSMTSMWGPHPANWGYATEPQPGLGGRSVPIAQGRGLGGGSSINAMMYVRGNRRDYDRWAAEGNQGWSHDELLPYFTRSEDYAGTPSRWRGSGGPLTVVDYAAPSPVSQAFIEAAVELGFAGAGWDPNGERQEGGAFLYQSTRTLDGRRCSAATAFLAPVLTDPNLTVVTGALATRVVLEGTRAVGVEYRKDGATHVARADGGVVLAAGTFASPKLLMLSGVGPAGGLEAHGIRPVVDLPGVGQNLQDHLLFGVGYQCLREQPVPALLSEAGLFTRVLPGPSDAGPDLQMFFGPVQFVEPEYRIEGPGFTFAPILVQPASRGTVTLRSADAADLAVVDPRYLEADEDVEVLVRGIQLARDLAAARPFEGLRGRELAPGGDVRDRAALVAYVRRVASTVWHPVGTCRMGVDDAAVVDPSLRVRGIEGLRVADASVMPNVTTGNTNAPTLMIGEKAADLIAP